MFAKLVAVVVALGACGCTLLSMRQSRIQIASEIAQTQIRINQEDERLWVLRARIAEQVTPAQVEQMAGSVAALRPLVAPVLTADDPQSPAAVRTAGNPSSAPTAKPAPPLPAKRDKPGKANRPAKPTPTRLAHAGGGQ